MFSSSEVLRKYSDIIKEAEGVPEPEDMPEPTADFNMPDESMMGNDDAITDVDQLQDPVDSLATDLHVDKMKLEKWLKDNKYELTPLGGLANKEGTV